MGDVTKAGKSVGAAVVCGAVLLWGSVEARSEPLLGSGQRAFHLMVFGGPVESVRPSEVEDDVPSILAGRTATRITLATEGFQTFAWWHDAGGRDLCLVHQGNADFNTSGIDDAANALIEAGCDVIALELIYRGRNVSPYESKDIWRAPGPALQYHMRPIAAAVNWALARRPYSRVMMTGISGGGFMTTAYCAADTRMDVCVEFAGSMPWRLREPGSHGRYHQRDMPHYASFEQLYLWGASDAFAGRTDRTRHQVLNPNDSCCFSREGSNGAYGETYVDFIEHLDAAAPGRIAFHEINDPGHHRINAEGVDYLLAAFGFADASPPGEAQP